jgi:hypothetical protein
MYKKSRFCTLRIVGILPQETLSCKFRGIPHFHLFLYAFAADQQAFGQIPLYVSLIAHLRMKNNHCPNTVTALVDATHLWAFCMSILEKARPEGGSA